MMKYGSTKFLRMWRMSCLVFHAGAQSCQADPIESPLPRPQLIDRICVTKEGLKKHFFFGSAWLGHSRAFGDIWRDVKWLFRPPITCHFQCPCARFPSISLNELVERAARRPSHAFGSKSQNVTWVWRQDGFEHVGGCIYLSVSTGQPSGWI